MEIYSIFNRYDFEDEEILTEDAKVIIEQAPLHAGPYGGLGQDIDKVLYAEFEDAYVARAIRLDGEWYEVPESQSAFIQFELDNTNYD